MSPKLVSTPKKCVLPTCELTQKRFVPHKTKQIPFKKLTMATTMRDDDGGGRPLSNVVTTMTAVAACGGKEVTTARYQWQQQRGMTTA